MIDYISFKNYRAFKEKQELRIRPITVLFGKNNSGKSAILKLPALISSSLMMNNEEVFSMQTEDGVDVCKEMRDVVYNKAIRTVEIETKDSKNGIEFDYSFNIDSTREIQSHLDSWRIKDSNVGELKILPDDDKHFHGVIPKGDFIDSKYVDSLIKLRFFTDYIGSHRYNPPIDLRLNASNRRLYSGIDGRYCYDWLVSEFSKTSSEYAQQIAKWYSDNFEGWRIDVDKSHAPLYHINFVNGVLENYITDTGEGIIQSLPIVIRAIRPCDVPTMIMLEEPETHLHPAAHGNLSQLIAESTMRDGNKSYLIETHSKNFILRLRRLIAEKKISKDDVALYYIKFNEETKSSSLEEILLTEKGMIDPSSRWPDNVFEESMDEVIAIRDANINGR